MKLSNKVLELISERRVVFDLALALGFTEIWIKKLIENNKDNGPLTTVKAMEVIKRVTGLTSNQILEDNTDSGVQTDDKHKAIA